MAMHVQQRYDADRTVSAVIPAQRPDSPGTTASTGRRSWQRRYASAACMTDLTALAAATGVYGLWGHAGGATIVWGGAVVIAQTAAVLAAARAWKPIVLGQGSLEFTRLLRA